MYAVRVKVSFLLGLCLVMAGCGSGGGAAKEPEDPTPGQVQATATYQDGVKDLEADWASNVVEGDDETLRFSGDPGLATGDVFLVGGKAYKVASVSADADQTVVSVAEPALKELFSSLVISGRVELGAANFTLDPALATASSSASANKDNSGPNNGWILQPSNVILDGWKTAKITGDSRTIDDGASVRGSFQVGGRFETEGGGWDPIFDRGGALLEVVMAPDLLLYLEKNANYPESDELCTTAGFGGGHGRIRIGTLSVPTNLGAVRIDLPFCASIVSEASGSLEVLKLSGKLETRIELKGSRKPTIEPTGQLVASAPGSDNARIPDGPYIATERPSTLKAVAVSGSFALEQSLELNAHGRVRYGAAVVAGTEFGYRGSAAAAAVDRYFDVEGRSPSPEVCIRVTTDTYRKRAPFTWDNADLDGLRLDGAWVGDPGKSTLRTYGTCACEDGEETTACTGDGEAPVAFGSTLSVPADSTLEGQLDATYTAETYEIITSPAHGTLTLNAASGSFTYTPDAGYVGDDSFTFTVRNAAGASEPALVQITVFEQGPETKRITTHKNRGTYAAPGVSAAKFSAVMQPVHGTLVQTNIGTWMYRPEAEYVGEDSFSYRDDGSDPIMVLVTVLPTCETLPVVTTADARTVFNYTKSDLPVTRTFQSVETKYDWESSYDNCDFEITAVTGVAGAADLWIKLPSKPEQSRSYEVSGISSGLGPDTAYVQFSNFSSTRTGGTIGVTREGDDVIVSGSNITMDSTGSGTLQVSFTVVAR